MKPTLSAMNYANYMIMLKGPVHSAFKNSFTLLKHWVEEGNEKRLDWVPNDSMIN